jgi:ribosomal protein S18 acetylase RimI-like enzyme
MSESEIHIIPFRDDLAINFKDLNLHWVRKYFSVEPMDEIMLSNPKELIMDKGGYIFFAETNGQIAGTFALLRAEENAFELSKMAVDEKFQGQKIGNKLLEFAIEKAKEFGAAKMILFSNTMLAPAIHLYKKYGFVEVPLGNSEYKRSNIKMEKNLTSGPSPGGEEGRNRSAQPGTDLHMNASNVLFGYAQDLRQEPTSAEELLWHNLRNRKLDDLKFRRQHPIDKYIADFYCHEKLLVIELDGFIHNLQENKD